MKRNCTLHSVVARWQIIVFAIVLLVAGPVYGQGSTISKKDWNSELEARLKSERPELRGAMWIAIKKRIDRSIGVGQDVKEGQFEAWIWWERKAAERLERFEGTRRPPRLAAGNRADVSPPSDAPERNPHSIRVRASLGLPPEEAIADVSAVAPKGVQETMVQTADEHWPVFRDAIAALLQNSTDIQVSQAAGERNYAAVLQPLREYLTDEQVAEIETRLTTKPNTLRKTISRFRKDVPLSKFEHLGKWLVDQIRAAAQVDKSANTLLFVFLLVTLCAGSAVSAIKYWNLNVVDTALVLVKSDEQHAAVPVTREVTASSYAPSVSTAYKAPKPVVVSATVNYVEKGECAYVGTR